MTTRIQSLGDSTPQSLKIVKEAIPLPSSRKEIVAAVGNILDMGKVQRVVIEVGQPIHFSRYVEKALEDPSEVEPEDPFEAMANNEIEEFSPEKKYSIYELLFRAFAILKQKGASPEVVFISKIAALRKSLGVDAEWDLGTLFGTTVVVSAQVPEGVIVLTGSRGDKKFSLRMLIPSRNA